MEGQEIRMRMLLVAALSGATLLGGLKGFAAEAEGLSCEKLASLDLTDTTITLAAEVPRGTFDPGPPAAAFLFDPPYETMPTFCRVTATVAPTTDSEIKIEVWMPAERWNGRLMTVGNGGFLGAFYYGDMFASVMQGYAAAGTNTGHDGGLTDASFGAGHPEKVVDFGHRAIHLTAVTAKAIVAAHMGSPATQSSYVGCSTGGRQGIEAAQRYPQDFDTILAGAPAANMARLQAYSLNLQQVLTQTEHPLPVEKLPLIREAALAACDADDGVADRVIADPRTCRFDPRDLVCEAGGDQSQCLTPAEADGAARIYAGPINPRTGEILYPPPLPSSEMEWGVFAAPETFGSTFYRQLVKNDPQWNIFTFDFDHDVERGAQVGGGAMESMNPDISAFVARGGKLLLWHGWTDAYVSPLNTIVYYEKVVDTIGEDAARDSVRLFMFPGMDHCGNGEGPGWTAYGAEVERLFDWWQGGSAPESVLASRPLPDGGVLTRPVCRYPQAARYDGTGDPNSADSFVCTAE
jgi:feruloyl esterase